VTEQFVFISCGQFTDVERRLGTQIAAMVRNITGLEPFFAEEVHDLNGLHTNILDALRNCVALIVVLHPRGKVTRPDNSIHVRASVWIEQEIAIAAYIQRAEHRSLPIIAFRHSSIGREGLRDLLNLNPIEFRDEAEVLAALPKYLHEWRSLEPSGIRLQLESVKGEVHAEHVTRRLRVTLINDSSNRITQYTCDVSIPSDVLSHWGSHYPSEVSSNEPGRRRFRFKETDKGSALPRSVEPRDKSQLAIFDYCTKCASIHAEFPASVGTEIIDATVWIDGREYAAKKTIQELAADAESRGAY